MFPYLGVGLAEDVLDLYIPGTILSSLGMDAELFVEFAVMICEQGLGERGGIVNDSPYATVLSCAVNKGVSKTCERNYHTATVSFSPRCRTD